jgi:hypothetical protein
LKFKKPSRKQLLGAGLALLALLGFWGGYALFRRAFPPAPGAPAPAAKILVRQAGIHEITARHLRALGWDEIDPASLRLEYEGKPYPFYTRGTGGGLRLYFYGSPPPPPLDHYTAENAYFLYLSPVASPQSPVPNPQSPIASSEAAYTHTLHLEQNELYAPKTLPGHTWYWQQISAPQTAAFDAEVSALADGTARLRVGVFALTESPAANPDHHIRLLVNGALAADEAWDGQGGRVIEGDIPTGTLTDGGNVITLEAVGDTGVPADIVLLDWIELDYLRTFSAEAGRLAFTSPGGTLPLEGLRPPVLALGIGDPFAAQLTLWEDAPPGGAFLLPTAAGEAYIVAGAGGFLEPVGILPAALAPDLSAIGADYVAIGPPELLEALAPLLAQREAEGLRTLAAPVEAVFDQFGAGRATPFAIRDFLRAAQPRFALLLGDWTHDPHNFTSEPGGNLVPSVFVFTEYGGETVSDAALADLDGDAVPEIAVGRVPARTAGQVTVFVEKTLGYEAGAAGDWARRVLAISDGQEVSFADDAAEFGGLFGEGYSVELIHTTAGADGDERVEAALEAGALFMAYFGHGSVTQLGKDAILTAADAATLGNGARLPIMINITCLAGLFSHPEVESLSEAMLWNPEGGAVASLSATSLTLPPDQAYLSRAFVEALLAMPGARLGEILLAAQAAVPLEASPGAREVLETFLLFGDPALALP